MGGGPESQTNTWNFVRFSHFFKKIKCSKEPKKQNKLNFYFSLSGVPNVRVGWVGSDVWDKVAKKTLFFFTPALKHQQPFTLILEGAKWHCNFTLSTSDTIHVFQ